MKRVLLGLLFLGAFASAAFLPGPPFPPWVGPVGCCGGNGNAYAVPDITGSSYVNDTKTNQYAVPFSGYLNAT